MFIFAGLPVPFIRVEGWVTVLELGYRNTVLRENQVLCRTHFLVHFWYLFLLDSELLLSNLLLTYLSLSLLQTSVNQHF